MQDSIKSQLWAAVTFIFFLKKFRIKRKKNWKKKYIEGEHI